MLDPHSLVRVRVRVQTTVHEALMFSSRLRFTNDVDNDTVKEFVEEVRVSLSCHAHVCRCCVFLSYAGLLIM